MQPQYTKVNSDNLSSISYEKASKTLYIKLKQKVTYVYYNVPEVVYISLLSSEDVEHYYLMYVKDKFRERKITA
ncbi:KTSC domain-containing protein [Bacillus sp. FJAT-45350]|uniref:KTSC domain-containing protein n=1 Tax=Bacillus sp. FJAT-45350 TaxID=2011014 RepID=UPI000BB78A6E|nr:KTSC domain-containing protein [Bacillus sp. FJAT-45350]